MPLKTAQRNGRTQRRRQQIMEVGKKLFLTRPYAQVSVEEIAELTGLSKATVYSYFKNKLDIYSAIILADAQLLAEQMHATPDPARPLVANLRAAARTYLAFFKTHPEYFEKLSWFYFPGREKHLSRSLVQEVGRHFGAASAVIEDCLSMATERGEIGPLDQRATAQVIYSQWLGLTYLAVVSPKPIGDYGKLIDTACELHVDGVLARAAPGRKARQKPSRGKP
jgi:AcrR family transcriptional regulator